MPNTHTHLAPINLSGYEAGEVDEILEARNMPDQCGRAICSSLKSEPSGQIVVVFVASIARIDDPPTERRHLGC